jgi:hypothetical protein
MGWMDLAKDMYQWQACVNTVMNHRVSQKVRNPVDWPSDDWLLRGSG